MELSKELLKNVLCFFSTVFKLLNYLELEETTELDN